MQFPALNDTIVAVATGWESATVGVVRLSGPQSVAIAAALGAFGSAPLVPGRPARRDGVIRVSDDLRLPVTAFFFAAPRSYTGQDVVELHTPGCVPLLRAICDRCLTHGARRALPGEFTSRAFLSGKLDRSQVEGVLRLIHASDAATARGAARAARGDAAARQTAVHERILKLLALIEAGIDFVDEEDVRFVTPAEVVAELDALEALLEDGAAVRTPDRTWALRPHVALVGLPNAGKSTLLNALLGYERAIVSPIVGTTRDVLAAELKLGGLTVVLQDCAGLGASADELESAAHLATERAADLADLVVWVHASDAEWSAGERQACGRIPSERRILALSKDDVRAQAESRGPAFRDVVPVSAVTGAGLDRLRSAIAANLQPDVRGSDGPASAPSDAAALAALRRARSVAAEPGPLRAELVALELRTCCVELAGPDGSPVDEAILSRVFGEFCIGK